MVEVTHLYRKEAFLSKQRSEVGLGQVIAHSDGGDCTPKHQVSLQSLQVLPARAPADGLFLRGAVARPAPAEGFPVGSVRNIP